MTILMNIYLGVKTLLEEMGELRIKFVTVKFIRVAGTESPNVDISGWDKTDLYKGGWDKVFVNSTEPLSPSPQFKWWARKK